jgi:hypothetical protein
MFDETRRKVVTGILLRTQVGTGWGRELEKYTSTDADAGSHQEG